MQQDKSGNDTKRIEWRKSFGIKRVQHRQSYTWRYNQLRGRSKITCLAYDAENELLRTEPLGVRFNSPLSPSSQSRHSAVPSPRRLGRPFFFFFFFLTPLEEELEKQNKIHCRNTRYQTCHSTACC